MADYLRRPNLKSLPEGQRHLISLVLWKLLASSTHAIAGTLETMAKRLQGVLDDAPASDLSEVLDEDYESLDETAEDLRSATQRSRHRGAGAAQGTTAVFSLDHPAVAAKVRPGRWRRALRAPRSAGTRGRPRQRPSGHV